MNNLPRALGAVVADILPLGNTLGEAVLRLAERRREQAREIFLDELRQGRAMVESSEEFDQLAAILLKYLRAAEEGAARLNLRLMAMMVQGMKQRRTLVASKFLYYSGFLATLSREEIVAISNLFKNEKEEGKGQSLKGQARAQARVRTKEELVPKFFPTEKHLKSTLQAATRTGLVIAASGWAALVYETTPLMDEVAALAPFRDALEKEPAS